MTVRTLEIGNAIIKVYRPELSEEERVKTERSICTALQQFGRAMQDAERERRMNDEKKQISEKSA